MDRLGPVGGCDLHTWRHPVRRNHHDGFWLTQGQAQGTQLGTCEARLNGKCRAPCEINKEGIVLMFRLQFEIDQGIDEQLFALGAQHAID